jgi:hypothetical protein
MNHSKTSTTFCHLHMFILKKNLQNWHRLQSVVTKVCVYHTYRRISVKVFQMFIEDIYRFHGVESAKIPQNGMLQLVPSWCSFICESTNHFNQTEHVTDT